MKASDIKVTGRRSASAEKARERLRERTRAMSPRERLLLALRLGQRGRFLKEQGERARR